MKKIITIASILILFGCKSIQNNSKTTTMNLKNLHTENKAVQTSVMFQPTDGKVISLQIAKNEQLAEHVTKIPALLVCISGNAVFTDDKGTVVNLNSGNYVMIEENVKHAVKAFDESNFLLMK